MTAPAAVSAAAYGYMPVSGALTSRAKGLKSFGHLAGAARLDEAPGAALRLERPGTFNECLVIGGRREVHHMRQSSGYERVTLEQC